MLHKNTFIVVVNATYGNNPTNLANEVGLSDAWINDIRTTLINRFPNGDGR